MDTITEIYYTNNEGNDVLLAKLRRGPLSDAVFQSLIKVLISTYKVYDCTLEIKTTEYPEV